MIPMPFVRTTWGVLLGLGILVPSLEARSGVPVRQEGKKEKKKAEKEAKKEGKKKKKKSGKTGVPEKEQKVIEEMFELLDANTDQKVTSEEWNAFFDRAQGEMKDSMITEEDLVKGYQIELERKDTKISDNARETLNTVFEALDTDSDAQISGEEWQGFFEKADFFVDGAISSEELMSQYRVDRLRVVKKLEKREEEESETQKIRDEVLKSADTNNDRVVTKEEWKGAKGLPNYFDIADQDRNGTVDEEELSRYARAIYMKHFQYDYKLWDALVKHEKPKEPAAGSGGGIVKQEPAARPKEAPALKKPDSKAPPALSLDQKAAKRATIELSEFDTNRDGKLSLQEWNDKDEDEEEGFREADRNHDNSVSRDELIAYLKNRLSKMTEKE